MRRFVRIAVALLAAPAFLSSQPVQLTKDAALHHTWAATSPVDGHVAKGAVVTATSHRGGYTHITQDGGPPGWVYSRYLGPVNGASPASTGTTTPAAPAGTSPLPIAGIEALPKPPAQEAGLAACPDVGQSSQPLDRGTNLLKNRIDEGTYNPVTFGAVLALPWQGMKTRRYLWNHDDSVRTMAYEGAAVSVTGYIVAAEPKMAESTNCGKTTDDWVDWHIWIVETAAEATAKNKRNAIVVETTPRVRMKFPGRLDLPQIKQWSAASQRVVVSGWLMLDPEHPTDASGTPNKHPSRGTIWEVHPVMKIEPAQP